MKKILPIILSFAMLLMLTACGNTDTGSDTVADDTSGAITQEIAGAEEVAENGETQEDMAAETSSDAGEADTQSAQDGAENGQTPGDTESTGTGGVLIAYFSKTGNTETIANMIASLTGGDLFKVETVVPYPDDYDETVDIAKEEQDNDARPELSTHVENMEQYDVIYLGYPNWWGTMPQAMFTFLEEYDFSGKTIIPFCTHGGSALGRSEGDIASLAPDAALLDGLAVRGSSVDSAQGTVEEWLDGLGLE